MGQRSRSCRGSVHREPWGRGCHSRRFWPERFGGSDGHGHSDGAWARWHESQGGCRGLPRGGSETRPDDSRSLPGGSCPAVRASLCAALPGSLPASLQRGGDPVPEGEKALDRGEAEGDRETPERAGRGELVSPESLSFSQAPPIWVCWRCQA